MTLHVLEERHDPPHLGDNSELQAAGIVNPNEAPQPLVGHVVDSHEGFYPLTVWLQVTPYS
jgi:hypothetical protein